VESITVQAVDLVSDVFGDRMSTPERRSVFAVAEHAAQELVKVGVVDWRVRGIKVKAALVE
jgi:hypothetical protein